MQSGNPDIENAFHSVPHHFRCQGGFLCNLDIRSTGGDNENIGGASFPELFSQGDRLCLRMKASPGIFFTDYLKNFFRTSRDQNRLVFVLMTFEDFEGGPYLQYKRNADLQLPAFVRRLATHYEDQRFDFENVEAEYRNRGLKGDFLILREDEPPISVSLKNYIGSGGITKPQVSSGTFLSFAAGFVFERVGVGKYADPRRAGATFQGSDSAARRDVLQHEGRAELAPILDEFARLP